VTHMKVNWRNINIYVYSTYYVSL